MNKKYIAIALVLLLMVTAFAACKKDDKNGGKGPNVVDGVELSTDEKTGEPYVTNVDGDRIPVTTDKDGFYDDISSLFTETTTKKSEQRNDGGTTTTTKAEPSTSPQDKLTDPSNDGETSTRPPIKFENGQDSIPWNQIQNA